MADTDPAHDDRLRTANYTGFQHPAMVFFCPHPGPVITLPKP
jgi:hypothetical protein